MPATDEFSRPNNIKDLIWMFFRNLLLSILVICLGTVIFPFGAFLLMSISGLIPIWLWKLEGGFELPKYFPHLWDSETKDPWFEPDTFESWANAFDFLSGSITWMVGIVLGAIFLMTFEVMFLELILICYKLRLLVMCFLFFRNFLRHEIKNNRLLMPLRKAIINLNAHINWV